MLRFFNAARDLDSDCSPPFREKRFYRPGTAEQSNFRTDKCDPCNGFCSCITTQPSGGTGSLRLPLIKTQQFTQTLLTHFLFDQKIGTKLNQPDLTLMTVSGCSLARHLIAKNDSPATAGPSSLRLSLIKRQQFTQTLLTFLLYQRN